MSRPVRITVLSLVVASLLVPPARAQNGTITAERLEVGKQVERAIGGGQVHRYLIRLEVEQTLEAVVEQKGVDVTLVLLAPGGETLLEVDGPSGAHGPERIFVIAGNRGDHTLEVKMLSPSEEAGRYEVRVEAIRTATEKDRQLFEAASLLERSAMFSSAGKIREVAPLAERAVALYERALGPEHPDTATALDAVARVYRDQGEYAKAEPLWLRALAIREKALGPEHPDVGRLLAALGLLYSLQGQHAKAEPLLTRALAVQEKALGPEHTATASSLNNLALLYRDMGQYAKAEPLLTRALAIYEKAAGPEHIDTASSLSNLAQLYERQGQYARAEPLYVRALAIGEKAAGPDHPEVATKLNNLANLYQRQGQYARAEPLFVRALAIYEKALGSNHPNTAAALNNLAQLYYSQGQYAKAEPLFVRALATCEKVLGPDHSRTAMALNNLASLYQIQGQYVKAEPLLIRSLAIREKALGPEHPDTASALNSLSGLYRKQRLPAKVEPLLVRALAIYEKALGSQHPSTAIAIHNLGTFYSAEGAYAKAEPLLTHALAIYEKTLGPEHPATANVLVNLAWHYRMQGAYAKAEPLLTRALAIREKALGPEHPETATALNYVAWLYAETGDYARAIIAQARANEARERDLVRNLVSGSERNKLAYLGQSSSELDRTLSLHVQRVPSDTTARRIGLESVLRRKGRALDALTDQIASLRRRASPQDQRLLDDLSEAQSRLSRLTLQGPGRGAIDEHHAKLAALADEVERLEAQVASHSAEFRAIAATVTLGAVQQAIPADAALVEYATYRPFDAKAPEGRQYGAARYMAYVLLQQGDPLWVELGATEPIDAAVSRLREALQRPDRRDVSSLARALDALVMEPVRALTGPARHLLLSPDAALNLVPFAALVDERGEFLVDRYAITYLTSGRDLLRLQQQVLPRSGPLVIAAPNYQTVGTAEREASAKGTRAADVTLVRFRALPATELEAQEVARLLPNAIPLTGARASESALKRASGPRVVHMATHGFFFEQSDVDDTEGSNPAGERREGEDALLRSGLAFAGANRRDGGEGEDGILLAREAAGLDLWGTQLVVLSACDTGLGEVRAGEGVYGLRRALVLAGSETQVMSLWSVDDRATRELMVAYYKQLLAGAGRAEAMRQAQIALLKDPKRRHPAYWASFIVSGDWRPLD